MIRSTACQSVGLQTVALNPPVVVTVPGRSEMARSFPLTERLDHGCSQTSQKLLISRFSPLGLTVAPSRTVHHHIQPSSNVIHTCLLGASRRSRSALKSCVAPFFAPYSACLLYTSPSPRDR